MPFTKLLFARQGQEGKRAANYQFYNGNKGVAGERALECFNLYV
jgi:hypothetical protein